MVAALVEPTRDGKVARARLAVGACSPVALRLAELEAVLVGRPLDKRLGAVVEARHLAALAPIDDIRGGADYRFNDLFSLRLGWRVLDVDYSANSGRDEFGWDMRQDGPWLGFTFHLGPAR